jgi:hypothetical protein
LQTKLQGRGRAWVHVYLKPIGNFEIDSVDALDPIVESLNSLGGLQIGLHDTTRRSQSAS